MQEKDISDLIERYKQMLASNKNTYFDADEYGDLVDYYDKLDDLETAKKILSLGLSTHPNNESLILRQARLLIYDANHLKALEILNSHFSGYDFELYLLKIECLLQLSLYAEAHELTAEILEDQENDIETILSELGFIHAEAEYFNEAILYFEKYLTYDNQNLEVLYDLAYAYESTENFTAAIGVCERILDIDPYILDCWLTLGKLHSLQENYSSAIDAFDFALTLDEGNLNAMKLKAHCLALSDRFEEATEVLKECIELDNEDRVSLITLIDCYMSLERPKEMLESISLYEANFNELDDIIYKKIYGLYLNGQAEEADKLMAEKLDQIDDTLVPSNPTTGDIFFKIGNYSIAEKIYLKALSEEQENENILDKIIATYIKTEDFEKAITYQKKLVEITNTIAQQVKLALLYIETGDRENFEDYVNTLSDEALEYLLNIFHPSEQQSQDRKYLLDRILELYESRLLYKNIKY